MTRVIVLLFPDDGGMPDQLGTIARAARVAAAPTVVLVGREPNEADAPAHGAGEVLLLRHAGLATPAQADQLVVLCADLIARQPGWRDGPTLFILPSGLLGEEIAARLAARFEATALGLCADIEITARIVHARRSGIGGRAELVLAGTGALAFACCHPCEPTTSYPAAGPSHRLDSDIALPDTPETRQFAPSSAEAKLDGARIIVSGGRGIGGGEGVQMLHDLAVILGGGLGGSLPTIDAGWLPVSRQIGQSGRFVAPEIYFAVAISGTPQHLAGIAPSSRIVAINKDPDAAIFTQASVGVVADWKEILPRLLQRFGAGSTSKTNG